MSWLWPRDLKDDNRLLIRIARLVHWCVVGFAIFGLVVSFIGLVEGGNRDPISFFAVGFVWLALVLLGRGFRYVVARE